MKFNQEIQYTKMVIPKNSSPKGLSFTGKSKINLKRSSEYKIGAIKINIIVEATDHNYEDYEIELESISIYFDIPKPEFKLVKQVFNDSIIMIKESLKEQFAKSNKKLRGINFIEEDGLKDNLLKLYNKHYKI